MSDAPTIQDLNDMTRVRFIGALGAIFEMSPWIVEEVWEIRPFTDRADLMAKMMGVVEKSGAKRQLALLGAHPDLAGKAARAGTLTALSAQEQSGAGLDRLSDQEFERFHELNDAYRARFGFAFIIAVKDTDKAGILAAFEARLANGRQEERAEALRQVGRIAEIRLAEIVAE